MKKIIATVLAMVMALALCTVAFAATTTVTEVTGTDYSKVEDGDSTDGITITAHYKLTADSAADYDVYVKSGDTFKMVDEVTATKYREGFKTINLALYANAKAATCSDDGYKVTVYQSANATYFAKVADVDAYNDANATSKITDTSTKVFIGTKFDDAVAYYQFTSKDSAKVAGGHALYKTARFGARTMLPFMPALSAAVSTSLRVMSTLMTLLSLWLRSAMAPSTLAM